MKKNILSRKIKRRKKLLNFMINYLNPCNILVVFLSQNLDKHILIYQRYLYKINPINKNTLTYNSQNAA
ncbi:MAG: hypothetical protein ACRC7N_13245 [Clostridium sp.]